jgi:hypothetical protein
MDWSGIDPKAAAQLSPFDFSENAIGLNPGIMNQAQEYNASSNWLNQRTPARATSGYSAPTGSGNRTPIQNKGMVSDALGKGKKKGGGIPPIIGASGDPNYKDMSAYASLPQLMQMMGGTAAKRKDQQRQPLTLFSMFGA